MNLQGSIRIPRRPSDGKDGQDGHSPYIGANGNWWEWDDSLKLYVDTGRKAEGEPGGNGLPGQIPIQKEWVVGDAHRNTDEIVDYIYVRGANKAQSYWYKLSAKGTATAGAPPTGGTTPSGYEKINWLKELAVNVLLAEEANVAGFIFKDRKLISQDGDGNIEDYASGGFEPNFEVDGVSGKVKMKDADIEGIIHALSGDIGDIAIENGGLVSNGTSGAFYISPDGSMHLYDSSGSIRTSIKAGDIPDISAYFNHTGSSQQVGLNASSTGDSTQYSSIFAVSAPQGGTYRLKVPSIQLNASATWNNSNVIYHSLNVLTSRVIVFLESKFGTEAWTTIRTMGSITARVGLNVGSTTPPQTDTAPQQESTELEFTMSGSASYRLRFEYSLTLGRGGLPPPGASGSGSARTLTRQFQTIPVINRSEIGNNGMMIATDNQNYTYMVDDLFQVRRGNVYFRVTSSGIQKSTNGTSWTNL